MHILGSEKALAEEAAASCSQEEAATNGAVAGHAEYGSKPDLAGNGIAAAEEQCKSREAVSVEVVADLWAFKRAQEVFASLK